MDGLYVYMNVLSGLRYKVGTIVAIPKEDPKRRAKTLAFLFLPLSLSYTILEQHQAS